MNNEPLIQRRVNVVINGDLHKQLRQTALAADVPMAVIIENALVDHFNTQLTFGDKNHGRD